MKSRRKNEIDSNGVIILAIALQLLQSGSYFYANSHH